MSNIITIYTDGSCLRNPGPGGFAAIIREDGQETIVKGGEALTTNNRMEMRAVLGALAWLKNNNKMNEVIDIYSDSRLLIKSLSEYGWKRKANLDLWVLLDEARADLKIQYHWVKGHSGHPENERCNDLAIWEAKKQKKMGRRGGNAPRDVPTARLYECNQCHKQTPGRFSLLPDTNMIKVDCLFCHSYIEFAPRTKENIEKAKKRVLINNEQLQKIMELKKEKGENVSEKEIKQWTREEAERYLGSQMRMF